jgi:type II secretory pathway pseudopilin PulG
VLVRDPLRQAGWTILEILLVGVLLSLLLALVVPNILEARVRNNEAAAVRTLKAIASTQDLVAASGLLDTDGDGRGEFAFLQELSGERLPRAGRSLLSGNLDRLPRGSPPGPLPQFFLKVDAEGGASLCGYRFRVLLPAAGGKAVAETRADAGLGTTGTVDAGLASEAWCAYAVPERRSEGMPPMGGRRTFFVNQMGMVTAADAKYGILPSKEFVPSRPEPGAAFAGPGAVDAISGSLALEAIGRDGLVWSEVR